MYVGECPHTSPTSAPFSSLVLVSDGILEALPPPSLCTLLADVAHGAPHITIPHPAPPALAIAPANATFDHDTAEHNQPASLPGPPCSAGGVLDDCGCCSTAGPDDLLLPLAPRPPTCPCAMAAGYFVSHHEHIHEHIHACCTIQTL